MQKIETLANDTRMILSAAKQTARLMNRDTETEIRRMSAVCVVGNCKAINEIYEIITELTDNLEGVTQEENQAAARAWFSVHEAKGIAQRLSLGASSFIKSLNA
jgi:hypothetical protein